jgi:hypothetical protein
MVLPAQEDLEHQLTVDWGTAGEGELTDPFDPSVPEPHNADATLTLQPSPQAQVARNDCYLLCHLDLSS